MKTIDSDATRADASPDLHGWKDIAAYLGKSVRAAQRWEQELDLPVRRIRTAAGQAIYAKKSEIDEWRARQEVQPGNGAKPAVALAPGPPPLQWPRRRWIGAFVAVAMVLASGGYAAWSLTHRAARTVTAAPRLKLLERSLVAYGADDAVLWSYDFGSPLGKFNWEPGAGARIDPAHRIQWADIDGDGSKEIYVSVAFEQETGLSDALFCFSSDGALRWKYQPADTIRFASVDYSSPWVVTTLTLDAVASARHEIWVAVNHHMWWPSMIVKITPDGRAERVFVQSGGTYALKWWQAEGRPYLLAAGINNEYNAAALAVIDPAAPVAVSPQAPGSGYGCIDCPRNGPHRYFVFPRSDVNVAANFPYNRGVALDVVGQVARLFVEEDPRGKTAARVFTLGPTMDMLDTAPVDDFWDSHRRYEEQKVIQHAGSVCPHRTHPAPGRTWTRDHGWRDLLVPTTAPQISARAGG